jgi:dipeptidase E
MKLLLTSGGLLNKSMRDALLELVGKSAEQFSIAFIPTAANVEGGDKGWLVNDLFIFKNLNPKMLDIVDISAVAKDIWQPRLEAADVLVFGGGNTFHLMHHIRESGLAELLPELLKTRLYVGISAGSMVAAPKLLPPGIQLLYYPDETGEYQEEKGLGFVDFNIRPHLNSLNFPKVRDKNLQELAKQVSETMYAIDDETAISVINGQVKIITEGEYKVYNA